jgi:uncharacterized protein (TIGR03118 family)
MHKLVIAVLAGAALGAGAPPSAAENRALVCSAMRIAADVDEVKLVSVQPGVTRPGDSQLVNAWGLAFNPAGPAWVADNGTGHVTVYDARGTLLLRVVVPTPLGIDQAAPTGQVLNRDPDDFLGDRFIFVTDEGTIAGWQRTVGATLRINHAGLGPVYKGVTIARDDREGQKLYVANFHDGIVEVYDRHFAPVHHPGFVDPKLPAGYAPFNVFATRDNRIFVAYAVQDAAKHDDAPGAGLGILDQFDSQGHFVRRVVSNGDLNAPWGMAIVPKGFGKLEDKLLVGNFGDGTVHVFDIERHIGRALGTFVVAHHEQLVIDGLWALGFGPDDKLYFTAGRKEPSHGLFGRLDLGSEDEDDD